MEILPQKYFLHSILLLISCNVALACRGQLLVSGLSPGDREIILHEHNKLRQLVATGRYPGQPGAENMREIVWDDELAARAQQWADNCEFRHDPYRTINRFTMGQNLATIWSTAPLDSTDGDFPSRIQSWFNEVQKYSFGDAWSPKTGHYSQLVWGETSLVGCGYSEYKDSRKYNKLYVCNYGPGGNVVGYNPYEVGKPSCATYGLRQSSYYQGLCAPSVAPSVYGINDINTYDSKPISNNYDNNNNNNYNNNSNNLKNSIYSTQTATNTNSFPKQATNTFNQRKTAASRAISTAATTTTTTHFKTKLFNNNNQADTTLLQTTSGNNKYKNKFEAYRPSTAEFQKSIQKHTILRTFSTDTDFYKKQWQQDIQQQQPQQQQNTRNWDGLDGGTDVFKQRTTTTQPSKSGWSLLTWRG